MSLSMMKTLMLREAEEEGGEVAASETTALAKTTKPLAAVTGQTTRCACICVKWDRLSCYRAKVRLRLPSGLKLAVKP